MAFVSFLLERARDREEGGVADDEGVSAGVGGELEAGLASALEAALRLALEVLECFPEDLGAGAETGWLRFCGIMLESR
jgi:hypothetical protein